MRPSPNVVASPSKEVAAPADAGFTWPPNTNIGAQDYVRERLHPQPGEEFYLHLSDLLMALKMLIPASSGKVLDYGCGGSPYRPLFGSCTYHRADLAGGVGLDFAYGLDATLPPDLANYDCILSTQVLEHVLDPAGYLSQCRRVMRPGGCLVLTTHGLFEDHGIPHDYWRWTVYGLSRLVAQQGFTVETIKKLTTGPRCAVFMAEREMWRLLRFSTAGAFGQLLSIGIRVTGKVGGRRRHVACDASFPDHRVVDCEQVGHNTYVAIALRAYVTNA